MASFLSRALAAWPHAAAWTKARSRHGNHLFAINLEHIGDIIDQILCEVAAKKIKRKLQFSNDGAAEHQAFHKCVLDDLGLAFAVFRSGNVNDARKLISEKAALRAAELADAERHLERLREVRPETLETTSLHLDVLRDLKRIHSHICSVAYPVLEAAGEMPTAEVTESNPLMQAARPVSDK
jgi:phosphate:Na+ symporter